MKTGRPYVYADDDKGLKLFEEQTRKFLEELQETGKTFNVKGWATYLGVSRPTLYRILKRGGVWTSLIPKADR